MTVSERGVHVVAHPDCRIEIEEFTPRAPGPGEVLIATECTLISAGTELAMIAEERSSAFCPGYSNVGRIVALGSGVTGRAIGERVLSLGCHASHVTVPAAPESVVAVPECVSSEEATFGVLGSVSAHGVRKARLEMGEHVLVTGMGLVGQLALQFAARAGCETLIASDLSEARLTLARELTGSVTLNPTSCNMATEIDRITQGRGLDCIIEASGYPDLLPDLFDMARIGGRIVLLGSIWHRKVEVDFMPFHLKELTLIGAHQPKCPTVPTPAFPWTQQYNRAQTLKMIADGRLNVRPLITHVLPVAQAAEAYRLLREERDRALGVVLQFGERQEARGKGQEARGERQGARGER
jgi:2-desacetyl-2-hydroxyethyl bacteriochlorophyllide A dehydrogenase